MLTVDLLIFLVNMLVASRRLVQCSKVCGCVCVCVCVRENRIVSRLDTATRTNIHTPTLCCKKEERWEAMKGKAPEEKRSSVDGTK